MNNLIQSILIGFGNFPMFAVLFTLPIFGIQILKYKKINIVRVLMNYLILLYGLILFALVFFPLPDLDVAVNLHSHTVQWIPCHFIADIIRETPLQIGNPHTYLPALFHDTILQYIFNIMMTVPFGMFLRYYYKMDCKKVVLFSFLLSLFIEIGQLTGLFFIYKGSYRFCDVDDLIANTLGGYLGFCIVNRMSKVLPAIDYFDHLPALSSRHSLQNIKG